MDTNDVQQLNHAIDALLPLLPPSVVHVLASLALLVVPLMMLGRVVIGFQQSGLWGALTGVFAGTNTPRSLDGCPMVSGGNVKKISLLLGLAALGLVLCSCAHCSTKQTSTTSCWTTTNGIPVEQTIRVTDCYAWTLLDANESIAQFQSCNSPTNQGLSVGTFNASSTSTNLAAILSAVVAAAVAAAK